MTAVDHETGREIVNPFVIIKSIDESGREIGGVFINSETFASCQRELVHPLKIGARERLSPDFYRAYAVVGEYNDLISTVSLVRTSRSETFLGYVSASAVETNLPRTHTSFESEKAKESE